MSLATIPRDILLCNRCQAALPVPTQLLEPHPTTLAQKLRANHVPVGIEVEEIAEILVEAKEQLVRYEEELSRLRDITAQIESQRETLQQIVEGYQCLQTAAVRRVPTEILHDIFSLADPSDLKSSFYTKGTPRPVGLSPLSLSRVCSHWRSTVLGSLQLWTSIDVTLLNPVLYPCQLIGSGKDLEMYLQRSGRLPLSIQVFEPSVDVDPGNDSDPVSHLWLQILAKHCRRWQFAKLILPSPYYSDDGALAKIYRSLPILQSLEIDIGNPSNLFEHCPMLNRISFEGYKGFDLIIPWGQITVVRAEVWIAEDPFEVLRKCPQLTKLLLTPKCLTNTNHRPTSSNLKSLSLDVSQYRDSSGLLDALTLPHLTFFQMDVTSWQTWTEWPPRAALTAFFLRSLPPLQSLILNDVPLRAPDLLQALTAMPTISELRVYGFNGLQITTGLLQSLTYPEAAVHSYSNSQTSAPPVLPRLKHLELRAFDHVDVDPLDDGVLLDMLESRRSPGALHAIGSGGITSLETVAIVPKFIMCPSSLARLRQLKSGGLEVVHPPQLD